MHGIQQAKESKAHELMKEKTECGISSTNISLCYKGVWKDRCLSMNEFESNTAFQRSQKQRALLVVLHLHAMFIKG